jgi:hypothetical protein
MRTDMMKLIVAFRNFANASDNGSGSDHRQSRIKLYRIFFSDVKVHCTFKIFYVVS